MWRIILELFLILKTIHSREKWNDKFEPIILLERYEIVQLFLKHTLLIRKNTYDNFITKESSDRRFLLQFKIYFDIRSRKSRQEWINIRRIANNLDIWYSQLASSDFAVCHDRSWPCVLSRRRVVDVVVVASKAGGGERFPS